MFKDKVHQLIKIWRRKNNEVIWEVKNEKKEHNNYDNQFFNNGCINYMDS